jgi:hypothetical protein
VCTSPPGSRPCQGAPPRSLPPSRSTDRSLLSSPAGAAARRCVCE